MEEDNADRDEADTEMVHYDVPEHQAADDQALKCASELTSGDVRHDGAHTQRHKKDKDTNILSSKQPATASLIPDTTEKRDHFPPSNTHPPFSSQSHVGYHSPTFHRNPSPSKSHSGPTCMTPSDRHLYATPNYPSMPIFDHSPYVKTLPPPRLTPPSYLHMPPPQPYTYHHIPPPYPHTQLPHPHAPLSSPHNTNIPIPRNLPPQFRDPHHHTPPYVPQNYVSHGSPHLNVLRIRTPTPRPPFQHPQYPYFHTPSPKRCPQPHSGCTENFHDTRSHAQSQTHRGEQVHQLLSAVGELNTLDKPSVAGKQTSNGEHVFSKREQYPMESQSQIRNKERSLHHKSEDHQSRHTNGLSEVIHKAGTKPKGDKTQRKKAKITSASLQQTASFRKPPPYSTPVANDHSDKTSEVDTRNCEHTNRSHPSFQKETKRIQSDDRRPSSNPSDHKVTRAERLNDRKYGKWEPAVRKMTITSDSTQPATTQDEGASLPVTLKHTRRGRRGVKKSRQTPQLMNETKPKHVFNEQKTELNSHELDATVTLECLIKDLELKRSACIECSDTEEAKLSAKLKSTTQLQVASFEDIGEGIKQHEAENKLIKSVITEVNKRKEVFLHFCTDMEAEISGKKEHSSHTIGSLRSSFDREVKRFDKGLPIYAFRFDIMQMIQSNQVSILIGETGSGKSTQLVQYLYEAGCSSKGLIACTQPRKLAAISLAEHVSREVGEKTGETYDYVDTKRKQRTSAQVVYMTDHMLLNQCIADPNLSKYSCLVIDEAHERSIHTDILIAFIKRCLPNRQDLKVIITSATIDPTRFSRYFGGVDECPIIDVPGRIYPVEVSWDESQPSILDRDYVSEAVSKVHDLHRKKRDQQGDILVFLTCPAEIERACKLAQQILKNEAVVLPLHGKLQPDDQQKVFETTPGKRKVIFSTNVAETSITIPGVVYVVDTGLSKELCYDPQKNMNSLEIRPISKSSADQRKGRAGRTCPGECHRLYSENDYSSMKDNSVPEILRITLAFAVIKLYEFGIKEIHSFEFVESPDRKALDDAIENLKFLGAIAEGKLTKLGRKMAMLPLEPNLSKVLFDAIGQGIGIEAAVAVSISTLAGRVFFRPDDTESQADSEKKRLPFCQHSGDQMTYLHTYYEWSRQGKKDKTRWCVENYVNAKSMRMVDQIVDEIRFILHQTWHTILPPRITSIDRADKLLPKIYFDAFLQNICVHLGHSSVGYWSEKLPQEQLVVYPASSLKQLSSVPQCVVYEKTQKTSQHFLLQALPVHEEWIQEAVHSGKLSCHPAENSLFRYYRVVPMLFSNLGPWLAGQLRRVYPQDRREVVLQFSNFDIQPVFEHSKDRGTLQVFAQQENLDEIRKSITSHNDTFKQQLRDETYTCGITDSNNKVKVVIGLGGSIQCVLMPGEVQTIVVRGINEEEVVSKAVTELGAYGKCTHDCSSNERGTQLFVKFQSPADAAKALNHRFSFHEPNIRILKYQEQSKRNYCLKVEWCRRQRRPYAFINFNEEDFNTRVSPCIKFDDGCDSIFDTTSLLRFIPIGDRHSIKVEGSKILSGATEAYIRSRLCILLPSCRNTSFSLCFLYSDPFEETDASFSSKKDHFETKLAQYAPPHCYTLVFDRPQKKHVVYKALVYFDESNTCWKMYRHLRGEDAEDSEDSGHEDNEESEDSASEDNGSDKDEGSDASSPIKENDEDEHHSDSDDSSVNSYSLPLSSEYKVELSLMYSARYTPTFFSAIKPNISKVKKHYSRASKSVVIEHDRRDRWGNIFVNLSTNNHSAFQSAKRRLARSAEPTLIECEEESIENQYITTTAFQQTMREIQTKTSTYIKLNTSSLSTTSIGIYGTKKQREVARREIKLHLESVLKTGTACFEVNLKKYSPGLMKHLVEEYDQEAKELTGAIEGIAATRLLPRKQILTLFATEDGHQSLLTLLEKFNPNNTVKQVPLQNASTDNQCCVCYASLSLKGTFYYRLENCGHVYCKECIEMQLQSGVIEFPVTCAADKCGQSLVWKDFQNLFKYKVKNFQDLRSASIRSYIASNPDKVHNCITPDCEMVYFVSTSTRQIVCGDCKAKICSCCHNDWHEGYTCETYKHRNNPDVLVEMWMDEDKRNRKRCPKCRSGIEKNQGCEHVECRHCHCHICWKCMKYFGDSGECYGHLRKVHGGFV